MSSLEEEAGKRKERLAAMKRRTEGKTDEDEEPEKKAQLPKPIFRSYEPLDDRTKENADEVGAASVGVLESAIEDQIEATKDLTRVDTIDLTLLAPRKIDWDLKRDVEKKLEKLERKTTKVIAELIRERLAEGKTTDLLSEVRVQTQPDEVQRQADLSDDED